MSTVKVVATIGPKTNNVEALTTMRRAGMDIARLNGSHADFDWHQRAIALVRQVDHQMPVLLDLPGKKIRTTDITHELSIAPGQLVIFCSQQIGPGQSRVAVDYKDLHLDVNPGDTIVMDDGSLSLLVDDILDQQVFCRSNHAGKIRNAQGLHLPGLNSQRPFLSDRDRELLEFASSEDIDFVGLSFVETVSDVQAARALIGERGPAIVSKIETKQALDNLEGLIDVSDALMIDRGDLSMETRPETIGLLQKRILARASDSARPVIVATQLLHSMTSNPFPTKAEISDITNSVLDGATALMLSEETAVGDFPVEAVSVMRSVADVASDSMQQSINPGGDLGKDNVPHAIGEAIAAICRHLEITKIVAITISGFAARMVAAKMPTPAILAVSNDPDAARKFNLLRGTKGVHVDVPFSRTSLDHIPRCLEALWQRGELADDDLILVTAVGYPKSGNRMNLIETHLVADLRDNLGWVKTARSQAAPAAR